MSIFNITFDKKATKEFHEKYKNDFPPEKLRKLRIYDLTDSNDLFRKYCRVTCYLEAVYVYIFKKHLIRFFKYKLRRLFNK